MRSKASILVVCLCGGSLLCAQSTPPAQTTPPPQSTPDYDEQDRPSAVIEAYHPYIEGIGWDDIWEAVRRQYPTSSPHRRATDGEYQAIKESIAQYGTLQRVIVDETGNVIAGRLRKRACTELGVQCPTEGIASLRSEERR